ARTCRVLFFAPAAADQSKSSRLTYWGYANLAFTRGQAIGRLRAERGNLRLRRSGVGAERGCRGRSAHHRVPGVPARIGEPLPGGRQVRLLADRCAAPDDIAAGAPGAPHRRG